MQLQPSHLGRLAWIAAFAAMTFLFLVPGIIPDFQGDSGARGLRTHRGCLGFTYK
jgi:hypothetical protein